MCKKTLAWVRSITHSLQEYFPKAKAPFVAYLSITIRHGISLRTNCGHSPHVVDRDLSESADRLTNSRLKKNTANMHKDCSMLYLSLVVSPKSAKVDTIRFPRPKYLPPAQSQLFPMTSAWHHSRLLSVSVSIGNYKKRWG